MMELVEDQVEVAGVLELLGLLHHKQELLSLEVRVQPVAGNVVVWEEMVCQTISELEQMCFTAEVVEVAQIRISLLLKICIVIVPNLLVVQAVVVLEHMHTVKLEELGEPTLEVVEAVLRTG